VLGDAGICTLLRNIAGNNTIKPNTYMALTQYQLKIYPAAAQGKTHCRSENGPLDGNVRMYVHNNENNRRCT
jgi:hypothetical protein